MKISIVSVLLLILFVLVFTATAGSQLRQWHLQNYLTRTGKAANGELGKTVRGIGDYDHDGNIEVAVAYWPFAEIWSITAHTDTIPKTRFRGVILERGDINGDGYQDFVISKPDQSGPGTSKDSVFIYFGDAGGIDTIADVILAGEQSYDNFGGSMTIGDLNGDGIGDLVIGAYESNGYRGRVYIYYGKRNFTSTPDCILNGDTVRSQFGMKCKIADVNGDGISDLVITGEDWLDYQHREKWFNYLDVYFGGSSFDTTGDFHLQGTPGRTTWAALALMDANGDGKTDILWTFRDSDTSTVLRIYDGGPQLDTIPDVVLRGISGFTGFDGAEVVNAGDMDGDGYDDIAIGDDGAAQSSGFVEIFKGGPRMDTIWDAGAGQSAGGMFGSAIDKIGDINGDGLGDIIIGEYRYAFGTGQGAFRIYLGDRKISDVKETQEIPLPGIAILGQNYPNPFNPSTDVGFRMSDVGYARLKIFNVLGEEVVTLVDQVKAPGEYHVQWNASGMPSGVYYYRLNVSSLSHPEKRFTQTRQMLLIK